VHKDFASDIYHKAWREDDLLIGEGICNDKGPMACFLIAARAIKRSGHKLKGDLLVSGVVAETSREPCDDPPGTIKESKELGARFLVTHGGVADYALVAEGTGFGLVWIEAGKFWYKVTLTSDQPPFYTPYMPDRTTMAKSPSMVVAGAAAIEAIEKWAAGYQKRNIYKSAGGTIVPKVQVGAVRSGDIYRPYLAPQVCHLYLDVRHRSLPFPPRLRGEEHRPPGQRGHDRAPRHFQRRDNAPGPSRNREHVARPQRVQRARYSCADLRAALDDTFVQARAVD
jgi:acetylornithine deacetylase/succinyl-diaminopimelate desuccinylase-like protein